MNIIANSQLLPAGDCCHHITGISGCSIPSAAGQGEYKPERKGHNMSKE